MAWLTVDRGGWHKLLVAGAACGFSAGALRAEDPAPLAESTTEAEVSVLKPDEDLGPIYRLPESSPAGGTDNAPEWKPNWRQPTPSRVAPRIAAPAEDPLAPPEIDLPVGTDAPPIEPEPAKHGSSRRRHGSTRSADMPTSTHVHAPPATSERRPSRAKPGKAAEVVLSDSPVAVEIPGLDNLNNSATLPEPDYGAGPKISKESEPPRRGFMARIFRSSPPAPSSEQAPRSTRAGWGGFLFRSGPISR